MKTQYKTNMMYTIWEYMDRKERICKKRVIGKDVDFKQKYRGSTVYEIIIGILGRMIWKRQKTMDEVV